MVTPPAIFDRNLLSARRRRALAVGVAGADFLLRAAVNELGERLATITRRFPTAVVLDDPSGLLAHHLTTSGKVDRVTRVDRLIETRPEIVADVEALPLAAASQDLVVSALSLQWANDLPGTFAQIRRVLRPDGLFLAALIGGDTLIELREVFALAESEVAGGVSPRVAPFADLRSIGALLQRAGFALPVVDQDRHTIRYDSVVALMHDLQAMGATNVLVQRDRRPLRRAVLTRAGEVYARRFAGPDGRIRATVDVIWLSGWAPDPSQQQPLKPGSARTRLADALGTIEHAAGDKAGAVGGDR